MTIKPEIKIIANKILIGQSAKMSLLNNSTGKLFRSFMPRRKEIANPLNNNTFDLKIYPPNYFNHFNPANEFVKWVLVEVSTIKELPNEMEVFNLQGGRYAVFYYKGLTDDATIFQYIYTNWLPNSDYQLDDRPHFEILGEKTKLNDPNSEEDIWIPIKLKHEPKKSV